jgi:hypothetical protein
MMGVLRCHALGHLFGRPTGPKRPRHRPFEVRIPVKLRAERPLKRPGSA